MGFLRRPKADDSLEFAPIDDLGRLIQAAIDDLIDSGKIERKYPKRRGGPRYDGFCARSCQAYLFLARDQRTMELAAYPEATVRRNGDYDDLPHYWLFTQSGILDLNFGPNDPPDRHYPYSEFDRKRDRGFLEAKKQPGYPNGLDARKIVDWAWDHNEAG